MKGLEDYLNDKKYEAIINLPGKPSPEQLHPGTC